MAENVFSPDAWTRARNRFVEDLTDEEQVRTCHESLQLLESGVMDKQLLMEAHRFADWH